MTALGAKGWSAVLYDVGGGSGHVHALLKQHVRWFNEAMERLYVSEDHDLRCDRACGECILTFGSDTAMSKGLLQRRDALKVMRELKSSGLPD
jgi:hypothetical protein